MLFVCDFQLISIIFRTCALNSATTGSVEARDFYCVAVVVEVEVGLGCTALLDQNVIGRGPNRLVPVPVKSVCASELPFWVQALEVF